MFRLACYADDEIDELYKYLSSTASKVIWNALDFWAGSWPAVLDVYLTEFAGEPADVNEKDFFEGISRYISPDIVRPEIMEGVNRMKMGRTVFGDDGKIGMELLLRKISRMKDKMADPVHVYTFDLFEEYLFARMLEAYDPAIYEGEEDPYKITSDEEVRQSVEKLLTEFKVGEGMEEELDEPGVGKEYANFLARTIHRLDAMDIWSSEEAGFESLYFWDTDYDFVFDKGFIGGIRGLMSGEAKILGYGYEDVTGIFTDAGLKAPLLLVGTEAMFDTVGELAQERMAKAMEDFDLPGLSTEFPVTSRKDDEYEEADGKDLPFN